MSVKHHLIPEYLRQRFAYKDGKLFWLPCSRECFSDEGHWKAWNSRHAGKEAGSCMIIHTRGKLYYKWRVNMDGRTLFRTHIVWMLHHETRPALIDHENRQSLDDRIENLRVATKSQNNANSKMRSHNTSGFKGVSYNSPRGKWYAQIRVNGKNKFLGFFVTPAEAHAAYCDAARKYFGEFACDGEKAIT